MKPNIKAMIEEFWELHGKSNCVNCLICHNVIFCNDKCIVDVTPDSEYTIDNKEYVDATFDFYCSPKCHNMRFTKKMLCQN